MKITTFLTSAKKKKNYSYEQTWQLKKEESEKDVVCGCWGLSRTLLKQK